MTLPDSNDIPTPQIPEVIRPDEVLPPGVTPTQSNEAMPPGFIPHEAIPVGFVLSHVLTIADQLDPSANRQFIRATRQLQYKYGRSAVIGAANTAPDWTTYDVAISNAVFFKQDAQPLPLLSRAKRAASRKIFGMKCDVNF